MISGKATLHTRWMTLLPLTATAVVTAACSGDASGHVPGVDGGEAVFASGTSGGPSTGGSALDSGAMGSGASDSGLTGGGGTNTGLGVASVGAGVDAGPDGVDGSSVNDASSDAGVGADAEVSGVACTRELLADAVDAYFEALVANDPAMAPIAADAKFTEDNVELSVGEGLWQTAEALRFKRTAIDEVECATSTESVVEEDGVERIVGVRLALEGGQITEIEQLVVREGDYVANNPAGLLDSASDDWESPLPAQEQPSREEIRRLVETYFYKFPAGGCDVASSCTRLENGQSFGSCVDGFIVRCDPNADDGIMDVRNIIIDTTAGIGSGFTWWRDTNADQHLFKVRGAEIHDVHAILTAAPAPPWASP